MLFKIPRDGAGDSMLANMAAMVPAGSPTAPASVPGNGHAPVISSVGYTGAVTEDGPLVSTCNLDSTDVDVGD